MNDIIEDVKNYINNAIETLSKKEARDIMEQIAEFSNDLFNALDNEVEHEEE